MPVALGFNRFAEKPVKDFSLREGIVHPTSYAYRVSCDNAYSSWRVDDPVPLTDQMREFVEAFLDDPSVSQVSALVIGGGPARILVGEPQEYHAYEVERLAASHAKLSALNAFFFGDFSLAYDDKYGVSVGAMPLFDFSPFLLAYPQLEHFHVYGQGFGYFQLGTIRNESLRSLCLAIPDLLPNTLQGIWQAHLPVLEHLELWLGKAITIDDLAPLLSGKLFPRLRSLGLCLCPYQDDLAVALTTAPLLERLKILDLSVSIFTDRGAQALVASPVLHRLEKLVVQYHFCSVEMVRQLQALPLQVEISMQQEESTYETLVSIMYENYIKICKESTSR